MSKVVALREDYDATRVRSLARGSRHAKNLKSGVRGSNQGFFEPSTCSQKSQAVMTDRHVHHAHAGVVFPFAKYLAERNVLNTAMPAMTTPPAHSLLQAYSADGFKIRILLFVVFYAAIKLRSLDIGHSYIKRFTDGKIYF